MSVAPRSSKELAAEANSYEYSAAIPFPMWIKTSERMLHHAHSFATQRYYEEAYKLYVRYLNLMLTHLLEHPELSLYKSADKASKEGKVYADYAKLKRRLPEIMKECEKFKGIINDKYEAWQQRQLEQRQRQQQEQSRVVSQTATPKAPMAVTSAPKVDDSKLLKGLKELDFDDAVETENTNIQSIPKYPDIQTTPKPEETFRYDMPHTTTPEIQHKTTSFTEGGSPMRTIFLPSSLPDSFLKIAKRNTSKKLETCGILCGKISRNAFFITHLIIPDQDCTPNTCTTKNEDKLFGVVDSLDIFVLGWIHTHPTQTCFMSSVDLHTHHSYQVMLNEAIAIVCAPKVDQMGIYRLTDPPGLPTIANCNKRGFHPHDEKDIYVQCGQDRKGHVVVRDGLPFEVRDLRS